MKFFSTRNPDGPRVDLKTALLTGLAFDGGLYLPEEIPTLSPPSLRGAPSASRGNPAFQDVALQVATAWFGDDIPHDVLQSIMRDAYDFAVPIVGVGDKYLCELFHGPSLSFKDFAAQFLMRILDALLARDNETALVLTATSGDTGSAVAAACHGRERIRAVVLYPKGKISTIQEQQIATWGGNVQAVSVHGTFDDCQRLVKGVLNAGIPDTDLPFPRRRESSNVSKNLDSRLYRNDKQFTHVTSANSINVGRLLPQTIYYWYASLHRPQSTFVVPSGNFGNLTAGVLAQRMGAPIHNFIAATNANDSVPRYLESGTYEPHDSKPTISNAMDVGDPSNFERLRYLFNDSAKDMGTMISGVCVDDAATKATIAQVHQEHHYFLDPHTAVAWTAAPPGAIVLSTADPAKFPEVMQECTGAAPNTPQRLARCLQKKKSTIELKSTSISDFLAIVDELPQSD